MTLRSLRLFCYAFLWLGTAILAMAAAPAQSGPAAASSPLPILFVHGNGDDAIRWVPTMWLFESNGYPADRLFAPELGGGALLDLGVYVVSFAQWVLGDPERVVAHGRLGSTGVEEDAAILLSYPEGVSAQLTTSLHSPMPGSARVFGTDGWIDVLPRFHHPTDVVLHRHGSEPAPVHAPPIGGGYSHELIEVTESLREGRTESRIMPLADTLAVQRILEAAGSQLGVHWSEDRTAV